MLHVTHREESCDVHGTLSIYVKVTKHLEGEGEGVERERESEGEIIY